MQQRKTDLLIIGGGPAGYAAAVRGSQQGRKTVVVEKDTLGGTCLNRGCIPTKALLESAGLYRRLRGSSAHGINIEGMSFDFAQAAAAKDKIVASLVKGLETMMAKAGVEIVRGEASWAGPQTIAVAGEHPEVLSADTIVVATGTVPAHLPQLRPSRNIVDSDGILQRTELPESLVVVGGGVIGCEFACIFASLGVPVTIVEITDGLLPGEDQDIRATLLRELKKQKIQVLTAAKITAAEEREQSVELTVEQKGRSRQIEATLCLLAVGRKPTLLPGLQAATTKAGFLRLDDKFATDTAGVYGAGDISGGMQLAHAAFAQGMAAVDAAAGKAAKTAWHIPRCVYTDPETAAVGLTEAQAREQYGDAVLVGRFSLKGSGKAMILGQNGGFCKVVAAPSGAVLGFHMVGPHATEMIAEAVVALEQNMTLEAWAGCIHPHPTVSEAVHESVLMALGRAFHG